MSARRKPFGGLPGQGLFYCGLAFIIAPAILNIAHDRLSGRGLEALPPFLEEMYNASGKLGVTAALVAAGLSMILFSFVLQRNNCNPHPNNDPKPVGDMPYFQASTEDDNGTGVTSSGQVILQTRKYLPQRSVLSGLTGRPSPRKPPG
jgi:hypothetical protein